MIIAVLCFISQPVRLNAVTVPQEQVTVTKVNKTDLTNLVYQYAEKYGASGDNLVRIINCENRAWDPKLQSTLEYKEGNRWGFPAGTKEKSYGLVQIHLPDHKQITYEQATDPEFAIEYLAKNIANGTDRWSCQ